MVAFVHLVSAGRYDFFANELYFIVAGRHPSLGYVDQPPLVPLVAAATQLFGLSIWMLRLPATLAAVGLVLLGASFVWLLGGKSGARDFAAIACAISLGIVGLTSHLTTSTFEPIAWLGAAFLLMRALLQDRRSDLIWLGLLAGLAMQAKWGIAVWLVALGIRDSTRHLRQLRAALAVARRRLQVSQGRLAHEVEQRRKPQPVKTVWAIGSMERLAEQNKSLIFTWAKSEKAGCPGFAGMLVMSRIRHAAIVP